MKRKVSLILATLLLLLPLAIFSVQATGSDASSWALVNWRYDPDYEGQEPETGSISFAADAKNYLRRYTTLSWDAAVLDVTLTRKDGRHAVEQTAGSCYIYWAGEYTVTVKNKASGASVSCEVTMLPVVKMSDAYLAFNNSTGKFWRTAYNYYPVIRCDNVDKIELDRSDIPSGTNLATFLDARDRFVFGEHTLKFVSGNYATVVYIDVYACLTQRSYDEELGKNCLVLSVGDFGEGFSVYLDGTVLLTPGEHKVTGLGQHTISAKRTKGGTVQEVSKVSPEPKDLKLQVDLLMEDLVLEEPVTLALSRWDATFYVNGRKIEGDYRVANSGKNVITAFDKDGNQIEGAFLVRSVGSDAGTAYTELELEFDNPHLVYAIIMIVPAALMIAVAVFFFLRRRRIV